jgi:hypothetical protein
VNVDESRDYFDLAKEKLDAGRAKRMDWYGEAMKGSVHDALLEFCRQDEEFAQAVAQGGSFADCMKAVSKCVKGNAIRDAEAWGAAVKFYFPGAGIRVEMRIDLCASVRTEDTAPKTSGKIIDLSDFF